MPSKLLHILERVFSISKSIPLLDDLSIQEGPIHKIDISKDTAISVSPGLVIFKPDFLPFNYLFGEAISLLAKILNRLLRVLCLTFLCVYNRFAMPLERSVCHGRSAHL